jgi:ferritin-like metal-binding protein YciE
LQKADPEGFAEDGVPRSLKKARPGFLQHRDETQEQIERLEQVFKLLGKATRGKTCEAIQGIIAEGEEIMEEYRTQPRPRREAP